MALVSPTCAICPVFSERGELGRLTDIIVNPDGLLCVTLMVTTDHGEIYALDFAKLRMVGRGETSVVLRPRKDGRPTRWSAFATTSRDADRSGTTALRRWARCARRPLPPRSRGPEQGVFLLAFLTCGRDERGRGGRRGPRDAKAIHSATQAQRGPSVRRRCGAAGEGRGGLALRWCPAWGGIEPVESSLRLAGGEGGRGSSRCLHCVVGLSQRVGASGAGGDESVQKPPWPRVDEGHHPPCEVEGSCGGAANPPSARMQGSWHPPPEAVFGRDDRDIQVDARSPETRPSSVPEGAPLPAACRGTPSSLASWSRSSGSVTISTWARAPTDRVEPGRKERVVAELARSAGVEDDLHPSPISVSARVMPWGLRALHPSTEFGEHDQKGRPPAALSAPRIRSRRPSPRFAVGVEGASGGVGKRGGCFLSVARPSCSCRLFLRQASGPAAQGAGDGFGCLEKHQMAAVEKLGLRIRRAPHERDLVARGDHRVCPPDQREDRQVDMVEVGRDVALENPGRHGPKRRKVAGGELSPQ